MTPDPAESTLSIDEAGNALWAVERLQARLKARQERDFARSDALRGEVESRGFAVKDTPQGTVLERFH